jgi:N-acetylglutamate synthase
MDRYADVLPLLNSVEGAVLRAADEPIAIERYWERNPGTSFVAVQNERFVGCHLAGHDGQRGYLDRLAVLPENRRHGIARTLVHHCATALSRFGIEKLHVDVVESNREGRAFWRHARWVLRGEILRYSMFSADKLNAGSSETALAPRASTFRNRQN